MTRFVGTPLYEHLKHMPQSDLDIILKELKPMLDQLRSLEIKELENCSSSLIRSGGRRECRDTIFQSGYEAEIHSRRKPCTRTYREVG